MSTECLLSDRLIGQSYSHRKITNRRYARRFIRKLKERMDARSAIADTMLMAMSTAIQVGESLRVNGQAVPRRSSRRLSDFSDIAHLTVAFHGMQLTQKQHKLIRMGFNNWREKSACTAGDWVHGYVAGRVPTLRQMFENHPRTAAAYSDAITKILEMAVESVESLDDSLGPLLVSYSSDEGIFQEKEGFDRSYWDRIAEGLCQLARQFPIKTGKYETISAWRIIILFILNKLDYGFELTRKGSVESKRSFDNPCYK